MGLTRARVLVSFTAGCFIAATIGVALSAQSDLAAGWDEQAAAAYLDSQQDWWTTWPPAARENDTYCISCHNSVPYALARPHLRESGHDEPTATERNLLANVRKRVRGWDDITHRSKEHRGTEAILSALVLSSNDSWSGKLSPDTQTAFDQLWALQETTGERQGAWRWLVPGLQPFESDDAPFYGATLAALAVGTAPEDYAARGMIQAELERLRGYLTSHYQEQPLVNRLTLLWASTKVGGLLDHEQRTALIEDVLTLQQADGGWSLTSLGNWERSDGTLLETQSDGYATGLVTFTLQQAGLSRKHDDISRGLSWLLSHQNTSEGSWAGYSLNRERHPSSDAAPFMSNVATAYAVLALTLAD